jgi:hypothetical protein
LVENRPDRRSVRARRRRYKSGGRRHLSSSRPRGMNGGPGQRYQARAEANDYWTCTPSHVAHRPTLSLRPSILSSKRRDGVAAPFNGSTRRSREAEDRCY